MTARTLIVLVQAGTFVALAPLLFRAGEWRLAVAQLLLAGVTAVVYL